MDSTKTSEPLFHSSENLMKELDIVKTVYKGNFTKILLVKRKGNSATEKLILKGFLGHEEELQRELNMNYHLSPHPNIVTSYNVSFHWNDYTVFPIEYAPHYDLGKYLKKNTRSGYIRDDLQIKLLFKQISSALDFMHNSFHLVHQHIKAENILVFLPDLSLVKLCDFGSAENDGNHIVRSIEGNENSASYLPPEITEILNGEKYYIKTSSDVWETGILLLQVVNGTVPWNSADIRDSNYLQYLEWLKRKQLRVPEWLKYFSPRCIRLIKRLLEPKESKRFEIKEIYKYLKDEWIIKPGSTSKLSLLQRRQSTNTNSRSDGNLQSERETNSKTAMFQRQRSLSSSPCAPIRRSSGSSTRSTSSGNNKVNDSSCTGVNGVLSRSKFRHQRAKSLRFVQFNLEDDDREDSKETNVKDSRGSGPNFKRSSSYGK